MKIILKNKLPKYILWGSYFYFSFLLLLITLQYIPYNTDVAFLRIKQDVVIHDYYKIAFFTHVYTSIFLMLLGAFQFIVSVNRKTRVFHKWSGRIYAIIILFLSGPSGLIMAYHANGGWIAKTAFIILSLLWMYFTALSVIYAMRNKLQEHKKFAIRGFALTLSAISLRLFKFLIVFLFDLQSMDAYRIVAWLGWTFNLIIAEYLIYRHHKKAN
ncbi:MAG: DUF2306 domain-containing protein [Limnohabitans sp.]|nr:DUF2306 domain-containing protein [Limnohabitans sp.]